MLALRTLTEDFQKVEGVGEELVLVYATKFLLFSY